MENENQEKLDIKKLERTQDGKYIIKLSEPINYGKDIFTQLELEQPKAKHIRKFPQNPSVDDILKMVGSLSAQSDSVIDELSLKDVEKVSDFVEAFS